VLSEAEDGAMRLRLGEGAASLEGLLDLLIESAELHRFSPGCHGSLGWSALRERLQAAARSIAIDDVGPLPAVLLLPEAFDKTRAASQEAAYCEFLGRREAPRLVCAPIRPPAKRTAYGWALHLKHLPNVVFWLPQAVASAWLGRMPGRWDLDQMPQRSLLLARVTSARGTGFRIVDLAGRRVDARAMPCASDAESQLADALAGEGRTFFRPLRFDCPVDETLADFVLLEGDAAYPLFALCPTGCEEADRAKTRAAKRFVRFSGGASIWDGQQWAPALPAPRGGAA
jgi:hypothetical protein